MDEYPLENRTLAFSNNLIDFCRKLQKNLFTIPLTTQLIRSGTSIGANYQEANGASSRKDFGNKIYICKKEAKEANYWLKLLFKFCENELLEIECNRLIKETHELSLIFSKIATSVRLKNKNSINNN